MQKYNWSHYYVLICCLIIYPCWNSLCIRKFVTYILLLSQGATIVDMAVIVTPATDYELPASVLAALEVQLELQNIYSLI